MTKEEQIEEMARDLARLKPEYCEAWTCKGCNYEHSTCAETKFAEALYAAGYRKADEVRKETAREITKAIKIAFYGEFDELIPSIMADKIDKIAAEYGVEINNENILGQ